MEADARRPAPLRHHARRHTAKIEKAEESPDARQATLRCIEDFLDEMGWSPAGTMAVAGALQYREYDVFTRVFMRLMMRRSGHTTDVSQDHEYPHWDSLDRFSRHFAGLVRSSG